MARSPAIHGSATGERSRLNNKTTQTGPKGKPKKMIETRLELAASGSGFQRATDCATRPVCGSRQLSVDLKRLCHLCRRLLEALGTRGAFAETETCVSVTPHDGNRCKQEGYNSHRHHLRIIRTCAGTFSNSFYVVPKGNRAASQASVLQNVITVGCV